MKNKICKSCRQEFKRVVEEKLSIVDDTNRVERFANHLSLLPDGNLMKSDGAYLIRVFKGGNKKLTNILKAIEEL